MLCCESIVDLSAVPRMSTVVGGGGGGGVCWCECCVLVSPVRCPPPSSLH